MEGSPELREWGGSLKARGTGGGRQFPTLQPEEPRPRDETGLLRPHQLLVAERGQECKASDLQAVV